MNHFKEMVQPTIIHLGLNEQCLAAQTTVLT